MNKKNILVIKHGALGDIILATAAFAAIRSHHRDAHISLLTTKPYAGLLAQCPYFDEILTDPKPKPLQLGKLIALLRMLRRHRWEWIYDLQTSSRTTRYQWLLNRPWPNISNASRFSSHPRTNYDKAKHSLDNLRDQLAIAGVTVGELPDVRWLTAKELDPDNKAHPQSLIPNAPYVLFVPGGAAHRPEKRWPTNHYTALAEALVKRGITPVLIGTNAEAKVLDAIAQHVPQAIHLGGKTSIAQLADLARSAASAVGNDTGPMHLIAATHCPSTVIFSAASDPTRSRPLGNAVTVMREANLYDLSVEQVLASLTVPA